MSSLRGFHPLTVSSVERLTDDAVAVTFAVPESLRDAFRYQAGQHLTIRVPGSVDDQRRTYSIASSALGQRLRVGVRRLAGGVFSGYAVDQLAVGDVLEVAAPAGSFVLPTEPDQARHVVAVAAGSGITPILSILTTLLEAEPASRATLVYGNRTASSVMFLDDLSDLKDRYPARLQMLHLLSREGRDVELLAGRVTGERMQLLLEAVIPTADVAAWYVCGPLDMATAVRATLLAAGISAASIHSELFHVDGQPPRPVRREGAATPTGIHVTVRLDGRSSQTTAGPDESLLETALRLRPNAPFACRGGICGTCRARVTGKVETVRDFVLEPDQRADGMVLACQSYPVDDEVSVDFDV